MLTYKSKENILKKIRAALIEQVPVPFINSEGNSNLFEPPHDDLGVIFAEEFSKLDGKFVYVDNTMELAKVVQTLLKTQKLKNIYCKEDEIKTIFSTNNLTVEYTTNLTTCDASITSCEALVARTGTMVLSSAMVEGRTASVYAPIHICIAYTSQLVYDIKDALVNIKNKYQNQLPSLISFASGPSRTADIEKTLVKGIHGPKEVFCILVEDK
jgi:L-lactate dehydrogenase complex protein LldG